MTPLRWAPILGGLLLTWLSLPPHGSAAPGPEPSSQAMNRYLLAVDRINELALRVNKLEATPAEVAEFSELARSLPTLMSIEDRYMQARSQLINLQPRLNQPTATAEDWASYQEIMKNLQTLAPQARVTVCDRNGEPIPGRTMTVSEISKHPQYFLMYDPTRAAGILAMPGNVALDRRHKRVLAERAKILDTINRAISHPDRRVTQSPATKGLDRELALIEQKLEVQVYSVDRKLHRRPYAEVSHCPHRTFPELFDDAVYFPTQADLNRLQQVLDTDALAKKVSDCYFATATRRVPPVSMPCRTAQIPFIDLGSGVVPWSIGTVPYTVSRDPHAQKIVVSLSLHLKYQPPKRPRLDARDPEDPRFEAFVKTRAFLEEFFAKYGVKLDLKFTEGDINPTPGANREITLWNEGRRGRNFNYMNWALSLDGSPLGADTETTWAHEFLHLFGIPEDYRIAGAEERGVRPEVRNSIMRHHRAADFEPGKGPELTEAHLHGILGPLCWPGDLPPGTPLSDDQASEVVTPIVYRNNRAPVTFAEVMRQPAPAECSLRSERMLQSTVTTVY